MINKAWEQVGLHLYKFNIENGCLYLYSHPTESGHCMVFVPDCTNCTKEDVIAPNEMIDKIAELSIEINKMQSSLREFEKQRHNPLIERVNNVEGKMIEKYCEAYESLNKLEKYVNSFKIEIHSINIIQKAIDKTFTELENRIKKLENK